MRGLYFFYIAKELYKSLAQELEYVNAAREGGRRYL